jgi:hypothetical protein
MKRRRYSRLIELSTLAAAAVRCWRWPPGHASQSGRSRSLGPARACCGGGRSTTGSSARAAPRGAPVGGMLPRCFGSDASCSSRLCLELRSGAALRPAKESRWSRRRPRLCHPKPSRGTERSVNGRSCANPTFQANTTPLRAAETNHHRKNRRPTCFRWPRAARCRKPAGRSMRLSTHRCSPTRIPRRFPRKSVKSPSPNTLEGTSGSKAR